MTNPNKPAGVTSKYGAPRCPKTDPLPGDYYVPVFGDVEHVVAVYSDGRVGVGSPRAYSGRTYTRDDWASGPGVYGRKGEPIVGDRASGTVDPWDYLVTLGWDEAPRRYDRRGPGGEIVARFSVGAEGLRAFSDIRRRMAGVRP